MKALGLIGGMSAESTTVYYQTLNRLVRERLGGLHSAELVMWSVDFAPIAELQARDDWAETGRRMADAARRLEGAGAQAILICANTMHLNAPQVQAATGIPLIHIGDATASALKALGVSKALLLGTRFTMEKPFYAERLAAAGLGVVTPSKADRDRLHAIIYDELVVGAITQASRAAVLELIAAGQAAGADGVIFGCTEITLLVSQADVSVPVFDTTEIHARAGMDFALRG